MAQETPFFFSNGNYRLFGVLHKPHGHLKRQGFVFCSPFAEEKLWSQRVYVSFARYLADKGYPVLRFDYMGNGDSEGDFEDSSMQTMLSDIDSAMGRLKEEISELESIGLLGLRFGATLALLSAGTGKNMPASKLILWEPILNGEAYMREMLRINLATQMSAYKSVRYNTDALIKMMQEGKTVNVDGYEMSETLFNQASAINLLSRDDFSAGTSFAGTSLMVKISRKAGAVPQPFEEFQRKLKQCDLSVAVEEPFWKETRQYYDRAENLFRITQEWLDK